MERQTPRMRKTSYMLLLLLKLCISRFTNHLASHWDLRVYISTLDLQIRYLRLTVEAPSLLTNPFQYPTRPIPRMTRFICHHRRPPPLAPPPCLTIPTPIIFRMPPAAVARRRRHHGPKGHHVAGGPNRQGTSGRPPGFSTRGSRMTKTPRLSINCLSHRVRK